MHRIILLLVAMIISSSCFGWGSPTPKVIPVEPEPIHSPYLGPMPDPAPVEVKPEEHSAAAQTLKVNVQFFGSAATDARIAKYKKAIEILKKVVSLSAFKSRILNFDSPYTNDKFYDTTKTNTEIFHHILDGNEILSPTKDNELDVEVEFYYAYTSTVGYTYPNTKRIYVNTKFFDGYVPSSVAANLMHEWLHKLGYKHAQSYYPSRDYSVPYAIGSMVRELGSKL